MNGEVGGPFCGPVSTDLLADLQAGLLDDRMAASLRQRARTDPEVARRLASLDDVRRRVAGLGADPAGAPQVPADVVARIGTALRNQPASTERTSPGRARLRALAAVAGLAAVVAAGAVGTTMLLRHDPTASGQAVPRPPSVGRPSGSVPLSDPQLLALLDEPADLGALADPQRRVSCLGGLGYPTDTAVLGARGLDVRGRTGILLLLPDDAPSRIDAVVVAPDCSSVNTGLLASTTVART